MADPLSRRGIVGFVAALAASPRAVEAQAVEALNRVLHSSPEGGIDDGPPHATVGALDSRPEPLTPEQLIMKALVRDAGRERRKRINALYACRSMSKAARRAYIRDARAKSETLELKFAKLMGWRAENDDFDEWG